MKFFTNFWGSGTPRRYFWQTLPQKRTTAQGLRVFSTKMFHVEHRYGFTAVLFVKNMHLVAARSARGQNPPKIAPERPRSAARRDPGTGPAGPANFLKCVFTSVDPPNVMTMATRPPARGAGDLGPWAAVRFYGFRGRGPRRTCYRLRQNVHKSLERLARAVEPFSHPLDKMTF